MPLPVPKPENIKYYLERWKNFENYRLQERSLNKLFIDLCPENKNIEDILLKVSALNDFYSTNIYNTYEVANNILLHKIDDDLECGNTDLVDKIKPVTIDGKTRKFYSFSSKYCSHHKPETFPIYDSYVEKTLWNYKKKDNFACFKRNELKNYHTFVDAIMQFKQFYDLNDYSLREIDTYLWFTGKDYFPRKN